MVMEILTVIIKDRMKHLLCLKNWTGNKVNFRFTFHAVIWC